MPVCRRGDERIASSFKISLPGQGIVIRNSIKDVTDKGTKSGIAVEFRDNLKVRCGES